MTGASLMRRVLVRSAALVVALSVVFVLYFTLRQVELAEAALSARGGDLARFLARAGRLGVLANDRAALEQVGRPALDDREVQAVRFLDEGGGIIWGEGWERTPEPESVFHAKVLAAAPASDDEGLDLFGEPSRGGMALVGRVEVVLDPARTRRQVRDTIVTSTLLALAFLAGGLLGALVLTRGVVQPVQALTRGVRLVQQGELGHRLDVEGPAEVAALAAAYNEMAEALAERTAELERQKRDLEEFVYMASHDLQSPLVSVQGFADRLVGRRGPDLTDEQRRWVERIRANVEHLGELIRGILDLSRLNTRRNPAEVVPSRELVERALASHQDALEGRGVELTVSEGEWPPVRGDVPRLQAIFGNLIDNALKYLGDDNGAPTIEIGVRAGGRMHEFWVKDNGVGIASDHHDRIFRPLERLKTVRAHGIGMGLSLVRKIVELHGGTLAVRSVPGEGATFSFTLPAVPPGAGA